MRNVFYLFFSIFLLSCSSDSDNQNTIDQDLLIGKWSLQKEEFYSSNNQLLNTTYPSACNAQSFRLFKNDNSFTQRDYDINNLNCELLPNSLVYGYWEKMADGKYKFTSKFTGENEEVNIQDITFLNNMNFYNKSINTNTLLNYSYQLEYYIKVE